MKNILSVFVVLLVAQSPSRVVYADMCGLQPMPSIGCKLVGCINGDWVQNCSGTVGNHPTILPSYGGTKYTQPPSQPYTPARSNYQQNYENTRQVQPGFAENFFRSRDKKAARNRAEERHQLEMELLQIEINQRKEEARRKSEESPQKNRVTKEQHAAIMKILENMESSKAKQE